MGMLDLLICVYMCVHVWNPRLKISGWAAMWMSTNEHNNKSAPTVAHIAMAFLDTYQQGFTRIYIRV